MSEGPATALLVARIEFDVGDGNPTSCTLMHGTLGELLADVEGWFLDEAQRRAMTKADAARLLGMGRTTLVEKLARRERGGGRPR